MDAKKITHAALFAAIIMLATAFLKLPTPIGYIHLGNAVALCAAMMLPPVWAAFSAGLGCALADLLAGYVLYMPASFIIYAAMGYVLGTQRGKSTSQFRILVVMLVVELIMVGGYFAYECLIYGVMMAAAAIPFNCVQGAASIAIGYALYRVLKGMKRDDIAL